MLSTLTVRDETMFGAASDAFVFTLSFPSEKITVGELIEKRVRGEVGEYNRQQTGIFQGLVQPSQAERTLNGFKLQKQKPINADEQCEKALAAFERSGFIVLVDDKQIESLEQIIEIKPRTIVTFLKLVPLVGG